MMLRAYRKAVLNSGWFYFLYWIPTITYMVLIRVEWSGVIPI